MDAANGLVQHAARQQDALLVMASSARQPWRSSMFGSVSRDVLRHTDRPVLLIGPQVALADDPTCTTLVPCIDAGDAAERAVPTIVAWQQTFTSLAPQLAEVVTCDADAAAGEQRLARTARLLAAQHVHASTHVVHDEDPVAGLERLAGTLAGPVYVATSARYTDARLHWHSTTQQLVHQARCPVLVVPARPMPVHLRATVEEATGHPRFHDATLPAAPTTA